MPELVALDLPGGSGFVDALRAVWDTGDAACPLDPRLSGKAASRLLAALRPTRIVSSDGEIRALPGGLPVEEGDALVLATSGSGGDPRGVILTHAAVAASALATSDRLGVDPARHRWLACLPLAHIGGLSVVTRSLVCETPLSVLPHFDAEEVERLGRQGAATHVSLVATALDRLDPSVFERVLLGGAAPPSGLAPNVVATYGMTETGSGVIYDGIPLTDVEVAIGTGRSGNGQRTEILLRAPMLFRSYRESPAPQIPGADGRGWFPTGDAGHLDHEGRLVVDGRIAEVIVTGGEKVWPNAVEHVLGLHPGIAEVAVWKRPDPEWGERVVAWVIPTDPAQPPSLVQLVDSVRSVLPPWAAPKELVLINTLPRTPSGKVRRRDLDSLSGDHAS